MKTTKSKKSEAVLVVVKPDGMARGLAGRVLDGLSRSDLTLISAQVVEVSPALIRKHYCHLQEKPFYRELIDFWTDKKWKSRGVLAMVFEGPDAVRKCRRLAGATNPEDADWNSIRGCFGRITTAGVFENVLHVSSSPSEARREIQLWFGSAARRHNLKALQPWLK